MVHFILHQMHLLWHNRVNLFWPIWICITGLGVLLVVWSIPNRAAQPAVRFERPGFDWSRLDTIAVCVLSLFAVLPVVEALVWADFTYYDNSHFTNGTLQGRDIPIQVSAETGRFWPLGHQEFNLVRHFTGSAVGYHLLRILELFLVIAVLLVLDRDRKVWERVLLILFVLLTPSVVICFTGLIYAEANQIVALVGLIWCVRRFHETHAAVWAACAVICAQIMLYYKETAFVLLGGFAVGHLVLRCIKPGGKGWDTARLRDSESRLDACLILMTTVFLLYYFAAMYPIFGMGYRAEASLPLVQVFASYVQQDILAWVFLIVFLIRGILIVRGRISPWPLWDGLALGGALLLAGYLDLRMSSGYYLAQVDVIAVLYVGRVVLMSRNKMTRFFQWAAVGVATLVTVQGVSLSAFRLYEAKNVIHGKAELGREIAAEYAAHPGQVKRLFFPYAGPWQIMEFASYLNYLGVPIEQDAKSGLGAKGVALIGPAVPSDGPCSYRSFLCRSGSKAIANDLIVILPDDVTNSENSPLGPQDDTLFTYSPRPSIPPWMSQYVRQLHVISPVFAHSQLPASWLDASISVRR